MALYTLWHAYKLWLYKFYACDSEMYFYTEGECNNDFDDFDGRLGMAVDDVFDCHRLLITNSKTLK